MNKDQVLQQFKRRIDIEFPTRTDAARQLGVCRDSIYRVLNDEREDIPQFVLDFLDMELVITKSYRRRK